MSEQATSEILNRPPRLQRSPLNGQIDIPTPPGETDEQDRSMLLSILPVASMGMMGIFYLVIASRSGGSALFALPMLLMGGVTVVISLLTFSYQKVEQKRQFMKRRRDYHRQLDRKVERLQAARELQLDAYRYTFPTPDEVLERVQQLDLSLWSRRPEDPDFLSVRLGTGEAESGVFVKLPDPDSNAPDLRRATNLVFDYKFVPDTAITGSLLHAGALGVIGRRSDTLTFAYSMVTQLATFHAPSDLDIYIFSSHVGYRAWDWVRWLPHTSKGSNGGYPDLIAFGEADVRQRLDALARRVDARRSAEGGPEDKEIIVLLLTI